MDVLNIYRICERSTALGPGTRFVIWVQGCLQKCKGCITPQSRPMKAKRLIKVEDLAEVIIHCNNINGITISGGEPFLQAEKLASMLKIIKNSRPELTVLVFSGYTIEKLASVAAKELLQHIDLLIDGTYIEELNDEKGLRGSSNQRFHFLTDRLLSFQDELEKGGRDNEIIVGDDGVHIIGIPRKDIISKFINLQYNTI